MRADLMRWILVLASMLLCVCPGFSAERIWSVGVARADVTPDYPIRLSGYGSRRAPSEGVAQKIWAKALAIGSDQDKPVLWITVDNCGLSAEISNEVAKRIGARTKIPRERIAVCSSHTHSAPMVTGVLPNLFASDIIPQEQATIDRYTKELIDKLEKLALAALAERRPSTLSWGQGQVNFAQNRRTAGGPVDHTLSLLRAAAPDGKFRALLINYACHCTTLGEEFNKIHGDWVGCTQEAVEQNYPEAVAMVTIGCGGDANPSHPSPGDKISDAATHGNEIAAEVKRMLAQMLVPLSSAIECRTKQINLPFQEHFTRAQWEERAKQKGIVGYHARKNLARLDRGEKLPVTLPYFVQEWNFGKELALVFLAGEVVVDYELRLKKEFDSARLWVNAYANDVPCYIPSRRVLGEGGYEAEESLWYYDRPAKLHPEIENAIVAAVHGIVPKDFVFDAKKAEFPPPKTPAEALASFRTKSDLAVELVASEPLIVDPVAIDFGPDGKLWVCEMHDYPSGLDGKGKPGGHIKFLQDLDGDGRYDKATLFLDGIPFPTGVMAWHKGALICAAPDILYAEDTNGDGKADIVKKLYSGFATHNFQARVNGLSWGLDGWVYGAAGLFGGKIVSFTGKETELSGRDFRIKPDTGEFEPVSGLSQQGRVRDDFGNWFGCDNSTLLWHFPMPEEYARRNPYVPAPEPRYNPIRDADPNQLFPASRTLERFNDPQAANRTTSACGLEIYRDELLGAEYAGNAFVCEPVHNLVHRLVLQRNGVTFSATRALDEQRSEFLASTDNWFRPVQVRTGPDGALWVVDMYRFVIEHPRWIPKEHLAKLDVRAGDDKGRIYRVIRKHGAPPGSLSPLNRERAGVRGETVPLVTARSRFKQRLSVTGLNISELLELLDSSNGPLRDLAHRELLERRDASQEAAVTAIVRNGASAAARIQALSVLSGLGALKADDSGDAALHDPDPRVRQHALRVSDPVLVSSVSVSTTKLADDPDEGVRFQAALSLGKSGSEEAGPLLARLAIDESRWVRAAVLTSATGKTDVIAKNLLRFSPTNSHTAQIIAGLITTAVGEDNRKAVLSIWDQLERLWDEVDGSRPNLKLSAMDALLASLDRKNLSLKGYFAKEPKRDNFVMDRAEEFLANASTIAADDAENSAEPVRLQAIRLLGRTDERAEADLKILNQLLFSRSPQIARAAVASLTRMRHRSVPDTLLNSWSSYAPSLRPIILTSLLSRNEWIDSVFDGIKSGKIVASEVPLADRQRLLNSKQTAVASKAQAIFGGGASKDRAIVLTAYHSAATLAGDSSRGSQMFDKLCSTCHALSGKGHAVGPDLAALRDKPADYLLLNILDPNAVIEPKFVNYQVETKDGRSLAGVIQSESATAIALLQANGLKEEILRNQIESIKASAISLMPEGLEQGATPQDFADLLAYLKNSGPARFGSASPQQAAAARTEFLQLSGKSLPKLVFASETLNYASWVGRAPLAHCRQTDGKSRLVWEAAAGESAASDPISFSFSAAMGFISQPKGEFVLRVNGHETIHFDVSLTDAEWESPDHKVRMHYAVKEANPEDSNGVLQIDLPASLLDSHHSARFEVTASPAKSQRWFGIYLLSL